MKFETVFLTLKGILMVVVSYLQVLCQMPDLIHIEWPPEVKSIAQALSTVNFDLSSFFNLFNNCQFKISFEEDFYFTVGVRGGGRLRGVALHCARPSTRRRSGPRVRCMDWQVLPVYLLMVVIAAWAIFRFGHLSDGNYVACEHQRKYRLQFNGVSVADRAVTVINGQRRWSGAHLLMSPPHGLTTLAVRSPCTQGLPHESPHAPARDARRRGVALGPWPSAAPRPASTIPSICP